MPGLQPAVNSHQSAIAEQTGHELVVVHTNVKSTVAALRSAVLLGEGLFSHIRMIALRVVPFPLALATPPVPASFTEKCLAALAADFPQVTRVDVLNCRDEAEALCSALKPASIVMIGPPRHWWSRREARLAKAVSRMGHNVLMTKAN